jgi:hypothetical protein
LLAFLRSTWRVSPAICRTLSRLFLLQKSPQPLIDFGCIPRPRHLNVMQTFDGVQNLGNRFFDARPSTVRYVREPAPGPGQLANPVWFD